MELNSQKVLRSCARVISYVFILVCLAGCTPNDPYRDSESTGNTRTYYTTFDEPPKYLDPARSYFSNEYDILAQIYEPLIQYHYLKRPYELTPLTAESVPQPAYYDRRGRRLPADVPPGKVHRAVYEIEIKKGTMFQNHPAFAKAPDGTLLYHKLNTQDVADITEIADFAKTDSRELTSGDYIYQIMRLADPRLHCPILPILEKYILGMTEFKKSLSDDIDKQRKERKQKAGAAYNMTLDEKQNPLVIDYNKYPLPGVKKITDHSFRITLKKKYPQFVYWLAMPFFSPMPREADLFYAQNVLKEKNINLNRFPVGTGPYRIDTFKPQREIVLARNENYHPDPYPSEGETGDLEKGLLKDAGKQMPFIDKLVFKLETEAIPRWNKFLQGYYDASGISSDSFDQSINVSASGGIELTKFIRDKNISLHTSVSSTTYYTGFNMSDKVVGGYSNKAKKLRQAISIALDYGEFIEIFANGRGIAAMSPLPPGIFGYTEGKEGINPYVYDWDEKAGKAKRKTIEEARRLMTEAGYPEGRGESGEPLVIAFDNAWTGAGSKQRINWFIKKFKTIGIQLENRTTDYNRYQDKMASGNIQFFFLGWNADYPDPENFFFLLYGPNAKVAHKGENQANYSNAEFDRLFRKMENMDNSPERLAIIKEMTRILQDDSPWVWAYHPVGFTLMHQWVGNIKPNAMSNNTKKYMNLDQARRSELRYSWNRPVLWPVAAAVLVLLITALPAIKSVRKRLGQTRG